MYSLYLIWHYLKLQGIRAKIPMPEQVCAVVAHLFYRVPPLPGAGTVNWLTYVIHGFTFTYRTLLTPNQSLDLRSLRSPDACGAGSTRALGVTKWLVLWVIRLFVHRMLALHFHAGGFVGVIPSVEVIPASVAIYVVGVSSTSPHIVSNIHFIFVAFISSLFVAPHRLTSHSTRTL